MNSVDSALEADEYAVRLASRVSVVARSDALDWSVAVHRAMIQRIGFAVIAATRSRRRMPRISSSVCSTADSASIAKRCVDGAHSKTCKRVSSESSKLPSCRRWRSSGGLRRCWTGRRRCGPSAAPPSPNSTPSPNPSSSTSSATQPPIRKDWPTTAWQIYARLRHGVHHEPIREDYWRGTFITRSRSCRWHSSVRTTRSASLQKNYQLTTRQDVSERQATDLSRTMV